MDKKILSFFRSFFFLHLTLAKLLGPSIRGGNQTFLVPNKKISVFRVTGLKIIGRVGTHIFFFNLKPEKKIFFMHFERHFAFQNA